MESYSSPLFAVLSAKPDFGDSVGYLLAGFGIVMLTLFSLAVVCALIGSLFRAFPGLATAGVEETPAKRTPAPSNEGVDQKVIAVIGAAVDQAMGGRYRIKAVKPLDGKK